jgi:hypothetical protein
MAVQNYIDLPVSDLNKLLKELDITTRELLQTIDAFKPEQFNTVPFKGSWTAGQVSEHLLKSIEGLPALMASTTKPAERQADEKVAAIESIFLDFDVKMKSPDFIIPSDGPHDKGALLHEFRSAIDEIIHKAHTMDLTLTCMDFPFPEIGELTRWEWICFAICHARRHTHQMKNIYQHITGK